MIAFGVIGFLILVLVFFVTKSQGVQRELKQAQSSLKTIQSQNKQSLDIVIMTATQLQRMFQGQLAAKHKHGLISQADYDIASFVFENFQYIVVQCCQNNETVEVAVKKALKGQILTIEEISQFVARQPPEVKVPWCKNTIDGFVAACRNLVAEQKKQAAPTEQPASQ